MWKHRGAVRERRGIGLIGMPYAWIFQVTLQLLGPVTDVVAAYALLTGGSTAVILAWLVMYLVAIQSLLSALSGTRLRWHKLRRLEAPTPAAV